ncbi:hypothetical protein V5799_020418 [Amblyomma americanum]|uniref:Uncharacterized protein n=1 Tax=Amblyomma americanum TaxID=6943 RepID=A0AAQ4EU72_AMBAM
MAAEQLKEQEVLKEWETGSSGTISAEEEIPIPASPPMQKKPCHWQLPFDRNQSDREAAHSEQKGQFDLLLCVLTIAVCLCPGGRSTRRHWKCTSHGKTISASQEGCTHNTSIESRHGHITMSVRRTLNQCGGLSTFTERPGLRVLVVPVQEDVP